MLLGLGLAVDYSLLMVNRFREARASGASVAGAVGHTVATAGRTVTFSALTVATALSGLFFKPQPLGPVRDTGPGGCMPGTLLRSRYGGRRVPGSSARG